MRLRGSFHVKWLGRAALTGAALAWLCVSCQDGYPIPATRCDDWCDASQWAACGAYDPATCVVDCELNRYDSPNCHPEFEQATRCMRRTTAADFDCDVYDPTKPRPCDGERSTLAHCIDPSGNSPSGT